MEINNLELVDALRILHEHVLRLEIPMANAVRVTVLHARQDLLNDHSSVLLSEAAPLLHLVKKVSALAKLIDNVIAPLIFKELIHAHNIGVILNQSLSKYETTYERLHDLVLDLELFALGLVELVLAQYFDTALHLGLSVHANTHLTEFV